MKILHIILLLLTMGYFTVNALSQIPHLADNSDTLDLHYTYWWPSGGPFTGLCGDPYSLVCTGTVTKIDKTSKKVTSAGNPSVTLYTSREGIVKIHEVKVEHPPTGGDKGFSGKEYIGEHYIRSDCFSDLNLKEGDKVIVFVYSYEGAYCIPDHSILKIESFNDPAVISIEKYIRNGQDPLVITADTIVWKKYNLDSALKQIIDCWLMKNSDPNK